MKLASRDLRSEYLPVLIDKAYSRCSCCCSRAPNTDEAILNLRDLGFTEDCDEEMDKMQKETLVLLFVNLFNY
jgi:hypothetical protein